MLSPPRPLRISEKEAKKINTSGDKQKARQNPARVSIKKPPERTTTRTEKGEKPMYTEYGYIGEDGIEYATEQEAYEAQTDEDE